MTNGKTIKILLVEDHALVREGLLKLLATESDFRVVGEASDGLSAVAQAHELKPDIVLMDLTLPKMNGIDATRHIRQEVFSAQVIGLSMHRESGMVSAMLRAGASGYVLKDCGARDLADAIRTVYKRGIYVSGNIAQTLVGDFVRGSEKKVDSSFSLLSGEEREVLQLIADGLTSKAIVEALHIPSSTVATLRRQLMKKLNLHSVAALTRFALREGLVAM